MLKKLKINDIAPASYNPRFLDKEAAKALEESIDRLGLIKPILVRDENMTIIAGHQRTKSAKKLGHKEVLAYIIAGVGKQDEVRFNQFHNMCELPIFSLQPKIKINRKLESGWHTVSPDEIEIIDKGACGQILHSLTLLVRRYGTFANVIANSEGKVLVSAMYGYICKLMNKELLVYVAQDEDQDFIVNAFGRDYGCFSYDNTPKETYAQSFAQKSRLRNKGVRGDEPRRS